VCVVSSLTLPHALPVQVPMQATLRILRSLDFAIWQIKSKVLFLANACTSVTSTVRLRSLALTVLHVSSILMVRSDTTTTTATLSLSLLMTAH
jgi:hypothetical protein